MTKEQIKKARTLIAKAGLTEENKKDLVYSFSNGATESLTAMGYEDAQALFTHLEQLVGQPPSEADKMKRKILSLAHEMHWELPGTTKVDMARVDNWCETMYSAPLDGLYYLDLVKAVSAFNQVYLKYLKGI
ncbi:hypothetical protein J3L18_29575 [Mucilaginibacter gossypii]|uniref:hypothetical protein n=1 Tax=Mucilaginibacter gossypii TaxID=551996 RepID=UPI000DCD5224|nr:MULTISPECIES: hypothetical protein [Mucilaginibacter]QTE37208.1 hypothetical protein J3L18_29575 [Mucilaginibacter gossypii]RAV57171.1 hypothetical protein DIU36_12665 [Mucilaginibacter rubeus]